MLGHGVAPVEPVEGVVVVDGVVVVVAGVVVVDAVVVVSAAVAPLAAEEVVAAWVISAAPPATTPAMARVVMIFRTCISISSTSVSGAWGRVPVNNSPL
jgi:hypothetical protein